MVNSVTITCITQGAPAGPEAHDKQDCSKHNQQEKDWEVELPLDAAAGIFFPLLAPITVHNYCCFILMELSKKQS